MSFKELNLIPELLKAIEEQGYSTPTPIQNQAIPIVLEGSDLMGGSQTGTGKTAGFTLPMLQLLMKNYKPGKRYVRALILTPTRELAAQVAENVATYGKHLPLKSTVIFGGVNINSQIKHIQNGVDIIIATPGRLLDHANQKTVDLSHVEILVLDEADRMLDMGFIHDIKRLIALLPKKRQNLLFSATFSPEIKSLATGLLNAPKTIEVVRHNTAAEGVSQIIHPVDAKKKASLLSHLISSNKWKQVLVFTRTKHGANRLSKKLDEDGITSSAIHGNKSQSARTKALSDFKNGKISVLVATDIAARGLDIDELPHVVNYELPNVPEDYVHRIGRTGRAGNFGEAVSLVCVDEHKLLKDIERLIKRDIKTEVITGFEPDPSIKAEPIINGRMQQKGTPPRSNNRPSHSGNSDRGNSDRGNSGKRPEQKPRHR